MFPTGTPHLGSERHGELGIRAATLPSPSDPHRDPARGLAGCNKLVKRLIKSTLRGTRKVTEYVKYWLEMPTLALPALPRQREPGTDKQGNSSVTEVVHGQPALLGPGLKRLNWSCDDCFSHLGLARQVLQDEVRGAASVEGRARGKELSC